jgi:carboxypeptidase Q
MMLESDTGVFRPTGFGFTGPDRARDTVRAIATLLTGIGADQIGPFGGGSDIDPSTREANIPAMSTEVTGDYFLIHHTAADTVDKINPGDMARNAAAIAVMTYVIADLPQRLGEAVSSR